MSDGSGHPVSNPAREGVRLVLEALTTANDAASIALACAAAGNLRHMLAFGANAPAWRIATLAPATSGGIACSVVDHDLDAVNKATERVPVDILVARQFTISVAPLVLREFDGRLLPVYRQVEILPARDVPADILLVDGPPPELGGRVGTAVQALTFARPGSIVLLPGLSERERADITDTLARRRSLASIVVDRAGDLPLLAAVVLRPLSPETLAIPGA